jgi:hypothetical protein
MFEHIGYDGWSGFKAFNWLDKEVNFKTINGKKISKGNFYLIVRNTFYYGQFEYPFKSGQWYKGAHTPLISKELFELVQKRVFDNKDTSPKNKEFAFTKLITCGSCGSGITAEEKFKDLKDGGRTRHVYYKCTRTRDQSCLTRISEQDLISKLKTIIDTIDLNKLALKEKIQKEVARFKRFQTRLLQTETQIKIKEVDIREYVKFILDEGETDEKREVLNCIKGQIVLKNQDLFLSS